MTTSTITEEGVKLTREDKSYNFSLLLELPYKLVVQVKLEEAPGDVEPTKVYAMCTGDLAVAEGNETRLLLSQESEGFQKEKRHNEAIEALRKDTGPQDIEVLEERIGPCAKWAYHIGVKKREGAPWLKGTSVGEDSMDSFDKKPYLLIATPETFVVYNYGVDEVKLFVPITTADALFGYEGSNNGKLKGLTEDEIDQYDHFKECVELNNCEGQAVCRQSTGAIYGTPDTPERRDFTIAAVCNGARIRSAISAKARDLRTAITSVTPDGYSGIKQEQVCLLSLSGGRFQELFGPLDKLVESYKADGPTILNNVPMRYE